MSHIIQHYNNEADIWRDAWRIADPGAANPVAVARTLFAASSFLLHKTGTDGVRKHPALRVIAGQLSFLYGVDRLGPSTEDLDKVRCVFATASCRQGPRRGYHRCRCRHGGQVMTERIIKLDMKKPLDTAEAVSVAAWTAFRTDEISYIDDKHGHIAAITHPDKTDRILTLNQAGVLADLIRGVQAGAKLRYYPRGAGDADHPMVASRYGRSPVTAAASSANTMTLVTRTCGHAGS